MNTLLTPDQINETFLKKKLMHTLFWKLHFSIVVDEHRFMDVFGVRQNGYTVEYEIKVNQSDLLREIRIMKAPQPERWTKPWLKWEKHAHYLGREIVLPSYPPGYSRNSDLPYFIPNEFYFYVPDFLVETAKRHTEKTPYGVIKIGGKQYPSGMYFSDYDVVVRATKMHTNKADQSVYERTAHELTIRNRLMHEPVSVQL
jgi:hypothetical protein